jgi:hypothetical protein
MKIVYNNTCSEQNKFITLNRFNCKNLLPTVCEIKNEAVKNEYFSQPRFLLIQLLSVYK